MQKKLIALAVAGLMAAPAFAQSNVTIYGRVDLGFMSRNGESGGADDPTVHKVAADTNINGKTEMAAGIRGGSRIGFKGVEDLGNGLKALFEMEFGSLATDQDKGKGLTGTRHSYIGLTGGFGTVVAGRLDGVRYGVFNKYDPFHGGGMGNFTQITGQVDRADNAIAYISPNFSGFNLLLAYSSNIGTSNGAVALLGLTPGEGTGNRGDARLNTIKLAYANGPISVDVDWERVYITEVNAGGLTALIPGVRLDLEERVFTVGGSYDLGVAKLSALYDTNKVDVEGTQISDVRSWFLAAEAPIGNNVVLKAVYGKTKEKDSDSAINGRKAEAKKFGIGVDYNLSKRTMVYADYGSISNNKSSAISITPSAAGYGAHADGIGTRGFDIGIAHKF